MTVRLNVRVALLCFVFALSACAPITMVAPTPIVPATTPTAAAQPTPTPTSVPPTATFTAVVATPIPSSTLPPANTATSTHTPRPLPTATPTRTNTPRPSPTPPVVVSQPFDGGGIPNAIFVYIRTSPGPTNLMMFQVKASEDDPNKSDGKGIDKVRFDFCLKPVTNCDSSKSVYGRTEENKPYCAFQDTNDVCNRWVLAQHNNRWPNNAPIKSGNYILQVTVTGKDGDVRDNDLNFTINVP